MDLTEKVSKLLVVDYGETGVSFTSASLIEERGLGRKWSSVPMTFQKEIWEVADLPFVENYKILTESKKEQHKTITSAIDSWDKNHLTAFYC